mmetsp:Transcript_11404/g.37446  ORF Transcript_11404/g.37446 Transcript_11404/m.37446 type:complete len:114 (-) Transcript_11404:594-935(-)
MVMLAEQQTFVAPASSAQCLQELRDQLEKQASVRASEATPELRPLLDAFYKAAIDTIVGESGAEQHLEDEEELEGEAHETEEPETEEHAGAPPGGNSIRTGIGRRTDGSLVGS